MDAETLALARRAVACKGWKWLRGMTALLVGPDCQVDDRHIVLEDDEEGFWDMDSGWSVLPDLSDPLTALGLLPLVRDLPLAEHREGAAWGAYNYAMNRADTLPLLREAVTALEAAP